MGLHITANNLEREITLSDINATIILIVSVFIDRNGDGNNYIF